MKVAIVSTGLGHVARGVETWAKDLSAALHDKPLCVTLFKGGGESAVKYERVVRCVQRGHRIASWLCLLFRRGGWRIGLGSPYQIEQTTFAPGLILALFIGKYHIVHLQDPWLAFIIEKTRFIHKSKLILAHGTEEPIEFLMQFEHVQELSPHYLQRHSSNKEGTLIHKWFSIPNFVDTRQFCKGDRSASRRELELPEKAYVILSVGALRRSRKRMNWLVQEFSCIHSKDAVLLLAGAKEEETEVFVREARERLGDRIRILENYPHAKMPNIYQAADVFVLCSLEEILGIAFLEAMACGIPCIGHMYPVTQWVLGDGGITVDMEESGKLAKTLENLEEPGLRLRYGMSARKRAVEVFSKEVVVDQMIDMYQEVLNDRHEDNCPLPSSPLALRGYQIESRTNQASGSP